MRSRTKSWSARPDRPARARHQSQVVETGGGQGPAGAPAEGRGGRHRAAGDRITAPTLGKGSWWARGRQANSDGKAGGTGRRAAGRRSLHR
jgi:hypothetical protein